MKLNLDTEAFEAPEKCIVEFQDTCIGRICIGEKRGNITLLCTDIPTYIGKCQQGTSFALKTAFSQLNEYLAGKRKVFLLPLLPEGTTFMKKVWSALMDIEYGTTCTYRDIAVKIGKPTAARAVGNANGANPIPIFIPCHRVVPAAGDVGGYSFGGCSVKKKLLQLERENGYLI